LLASYDFDLVGEWETVTARRLWVLIQGLPNDSALWREENRWTQQDELLAELLEMTDIASRRTVMALGGEVKGKPIQIERPSEEKSVKPKITSDSREIAAWFAQHSGV
jgi:hypothetical protein